MPFSQSTRMLPLHVRAGLLIVAIASCCATTSLCAQEFLSTQPPAPVVAKLVQRRDVVIRQTFVGTVTPTRTSLVGSPVEGQVVAYHVREGDYVKRGDKLAQLRPKKLEIQLAGAEAELALLQNQIEDLRVTLPIEIERARSRKEAAEALQHFASEQYDRVKDLGSSSPVTSSELDELKSAADSAMHIFDERAGALQLAERTGPAKIAQAAARIKVQEEAINELRDAIAQHTILAPFDGYITKEHTEIGQWITKGGAVVEIVELNEVDTILPVLETHIAELRVRTEESAGTQTRNIAIEAIRDETFQGEVVAIVPKADFQSRTFPVKVRVQNRRNPHTDTVMLKPGMFARVTLPVRTVKNAIMIPKDALVLDRRTPTVWQINSSSDASTTRGSSIRSLTVEIDPDISVDDWIQLVGPVAADGSLPLQAGDVVITEGNERVTLRSTVTTSNSPSPE